MDLMDEYMREDWLGELNGDHKGNTRSERAQIKWKENKRTDERTGSHEFATNIVTHTDHILIRKEYFE